MATHHTTHDLHPLPTEMMCQIAQHMDNKTLFNFRLAGSLASQSSWDTWCKRFATDLSVLLCAQGIEELEQGVVSWGMLRLVRRLTFLGVTVGFHYPAEPGLRRDRALRARHRAQTWIDSFSQSLDRWIVRLGDILATVNPMATVGMLSCSRDKIIERSFGYRGLAALFRHRNASQDWRIVCTGEGVAEMVFRANALLSTPFRHFLLGGTLSGMGSSGPRDPEPPLMLRLSCSTLTFLSLDLRDWADMIDRGEIESMVFISRILESSVNLHGLSLSNFVLNDKQYVPGGYGYLWPLIGPLQGQPRSPLRQLHLMCWDNVEADDLLFVISVFADGLTDLVLDDIALPELDSWRELFSQLLNTAIRLEALHLTGAQWPSLIEEVADRDFITLPWMPLWDPANTTMTICADTRARVQKGLMQLSCHSLSHKDSPAASEWGNWDVRGDGVFIYEGRITG